MSEFIGLVLTSPSFFSVFKYPKGLGNTVEEIDTSPFKERVFHKTKFSMVIPEVEEQLKQLNIENIVLMGIEVLSKTPSLL